MLQRGFEAQLGGQPTAREARKYKFKCTTGRENSLFKPPNPTTPACLLGNLFLPGKCLPGCKLVSRKSSLTQRQSEGAFSPSNNIHQCNIRNNCLICLTVRGRRLQFAKISVYFQVIFFKKKYSFHGGCASGCDFSLH